MSKDNVVSLYPLAAGAIADPLTDLLRRNARPLVEVVVAAEFEVYLSVFSEERLPDGRRQVVRNGYLPAREILTGIGGVEVAVPKARGRSSTLEPIHSSLAPRYVRRCASLDAAIRGCICGGFRLGTGARLCPPWWGKRLPKVSRRSWRWATGRWDFGRRCRRCIKRRAASAAGCTSRETC